MLYFYARSGEGSHLNILYLSQRLPYPPNRGDRIPVFHHIRVLSGRHRMHVASLVSGPEEEAHVGELRRWAASVTVARQSRWRSRIGMVWALLTGRPLSIGFFDNRRLREAIKEVIRRERIDAVVVFSSSMAPYVEPLNSLVRVMNFCDVDSCKWSDLAKTEGFPRSWIYRREARKLEDYERRIDAAFAGSCFVTGGEVALFRKLVPGTRAVVVPNGVDHAKFGAVARRPAGGTLVFVGVMDYPPNVEAAVFFATKVLPLLRRKSSGIDFVIVGARPAPEVRALGDLPGITVTGFVDDVRVFLARAALVVIPLSVARGVQNKVLEAIASASPVLVSEPVAISLSEALKARVHVAVRKPEPFAEAIERILALPDGEREAMAKSAQEILLSETTWEASADRLEELIESARGRGLPPA
jgi:sugar transferase (PEP-CTERM/EpsH1 system associated)